MNKKDKLTAFIWNRYLFDILQSTAMTFFSYLGLSVQMHSGYTVYLHI